MEVRVKVGYGIKPQRKLQEILRLSSRTIPFSPPFSPDGMRPMSRGNSETYPKHGTSPRSGGVRTTRKVSSCCTPRNGGKGRGGAVEEGEWVGDRLQGSGSVSIHCFALLSHQTDLGAFDPSYQPPPTPTPISTCACPSIG
jgi:hypothetical protein